jgi:hypothetical protein
VSNKIPESVPVVTHTADLKVLLIRADAAGLGNRLRTAGKR